MKQRIDYGFAEAKTTYGIIGVKVWVYKGEIFDLHAPVVEEAPAPKGKGDREPRGERAGRGKE